MLPRLAGLMKIYVVFMLSALLVNVALEIVVPTPEKGRVIAEHGWGHYLAVNVRGIVLFYAVFNLVGSTIYYDTNMRSVEMGLASLVLGFFLEFAFMKPDWVLHILAMKPGPVDVVAFMVSILIWYAAWGLPSYMIQRYIMRLENRK